MNIIVIVSHSLFCDIEYSQVYYDNTIQYKYIFYFTSYNIQYDSIQATVVNEFTIAITHYLYKIFDTLFSD